MSQINFVAEFRAIMETCRRDSVPGRTRLLWIALFYLANDRAREDEQTGAWEWPDEFFPVNNAELATHCPLEKRAMLEARNRLKQMGVIDFKAGDNAAKPAKYRIKYLSVFQRFKNAPQGVPQQVPQGVPQQVPQSAPQGVPCYININRDTGINPGRRDEDEDDEDVIRAGAREEDDPITDRAEREGDICGAFTRFVGRRPYPAELERLVWCSHAMHFLPVMVAKAIEIAAGSGAEKPAQYAMTILEDWKNNDVMQPHQISGYQWDEDIQRGKAPVFAGTGDSVEDWKIREMHREERRQENLQAGIG